MVNQNEEVVEEESTEEEAPKKSSRRAKKPKYDAVQNMDGFDSSVVAYVFEIFVLGGDEPATKKVVATSHKQAAKLVGSRVQDSTVISQSVYTE